MLQQIQIFWNKAKYGIIATALAILYAIGYKKGKEKEQLRQMKGTLKNVEEAKKIRNTLTDNDRIKRLHNKYKR